MWMMNLPANASYYAKLRTAANVDEEQQNKLSALESTLDEFNVGEAREDVGEAMLRLEVLYTVWTLPKGADNKTRTLFRMYRYFVNKYNT